jgi:hypothetical protein
MCLSKISNEELIIELNNRDLLTNSKSNGMLLNELNNNVKVILTYGEPSDKMRCRECKEMKDADCFSFYQARVGSDGFLMRSNALCCDCSKENNKQRKEVFDNADIPPKPKSGDVCTNCEREWDGNWHRHHVGDEFIAYICGHCNMSFSDQRNKKNLILK